MHNFSVVWCIISQRPSEIVHYFTAASALNTEALNAKRYSCIQMSSDPPRKKRRHVLPKFIFVKAPGSKKNKHQNVRYSTNALGTLSTSSSTIWTEDQALESEAPMQETELAETNEAVMHNEEEALFNSTVDESYLQHLDELEPEEKSKRIRPKGVRKNSLQFNSG